LPGDFAALRAALKPLVGGDLARVVFVSLRRSGTRRTARPAPAERAGFDIHPASPSTASAARDHALRHDEFFPGSSARAVRRRRRVRRG